MGYSLLRLTAFVEFEGLDLSSGFYTVEADGELLRIKGLLELPLYEVWYVQFTGGTVVFKLDKGIIRLTRTGTAYYALESQLYKWWREKVGEVMLARGSKIYESKCFIKAETPLGSGSGRGFVALYEDCIIAYLPGAVYKGPLALLEKVSRGNAELEIEGEDYTFNISKLGFAIETLEKKVSDTHGRLVEETYSLLRQYLPSAGSVEISRLSRRMAGGRPVSMDQLERAGLWRELYRRMIEAPLYKTVDYILSEASEVYISVWRDPVSVYLTVLARLEGGTVLEPASEKGHATYIFSSGVEPGVLGRALVYTGLRREPIFMEKDDMLKPENLRYHYAVRRLPYLRLLRKNYKGRVVHTGFENWRSKVEKLLKA